MARPETLVAGNCYFLFGYHDKELLVPCISTLIYLECGSDDEGVRRWLFRLGSSLHEADAGEGPDEQETDLLGFGDDQLYQILDFQGLIKELSVVAVDHPLRSVEDRSAAFLLPDADFGDLSDRVQQFLNDSEYVSLTITIAYTDDGFSLSREDDGGFEVGFFPHPRLEPQEEPRIRAFFAARRVQPHVDYVADRGRTRILSFAASPEHEALVKLCQNLLVEIYQIRADDSLRYRFLSRRDVKRQA